MSEIKEQYRRLTKRFSEYNLEPEQLLSKLNQIMELAIESTEERINPKMSEPIAVKVRNLAVARQCVGDLIMLRDKILLLSQDDVQQDDIRYELVQTWVSPDSDWQGDNVTTPDNDGVTQ